MIETMLELLFNSARDAIICVDIDGNISLWNKAAEKMFGYSAEEAIGKNVHSLLCDEENFTKYNTAFDNFKKTGNGSYVDKTIELIARKKDNCCIYVELSLSSVKTESGYGAIAIIRDVSDKKKLESQILQSVDMWLNTFNSINDSVMILDENQTVRLANTVSSKILGINEKEVVGKKCYELVHDSNTPISECPFLKSKDSCKREVMELYTHDKVLLVTVDPIIENGKFSGAYHTIRDITPEVKYRESLKESEEKFKQLAESAPIAIAIFQNNMWVYANKKAEEISEYSKDELYKMSIIDFVHPDYKDMILGLAYKSIFHDIHTAGVEFKIITKSGKEKVMFLKGNKISFNKKPAVIISVIDITEKKEMENMLFHSQKMESIGRLSSGIAHDFNNILTVIMNYAELLKLVLVDKNPQITKICQEIINVTEKGANLTSQLLAFSRKQNLNPKVINLNKVIESSLKMLKTLAGEHIKIEFLPDKNLENIFADPAQIDQILINLCANAKDAIDGEGNIIISTNTLILEKPTDSATKSCQYAIISFSDNGKGIEKDILKNIFEPFFTTKQPGKGTGLGLATVYGIVKQTGGFIDVETELGKGTTFKLYFPIHTDKSDKSEALNNALHFDFSKISVLLVDDEEHVLEATKRMLEFAGAKVFASNDPFEAIELFKLNKDEINLVITDLAMPGLNGLKLIEEISKENPLIKSIIVSGHAQDVIYKYEKLESYPTFIPKPFNLRILKDKIAEIFN
ncbi:PAS domain S-box protein [Deferribacteraceae bacterium V6Fe1]|nr:PAS domain S-box protein [Deferribacteraceae bacterium V6Fe1]